MFFKIHLMTSKLQALNFINLEFILYLVNCYLKISKVFSISAYVIFSNFLVISQFSIRNNSKKSLVCAVIPDCPKIKLILYLSPPGAL